MLSPSHFHLIHCCCFHSTSASFLVWFGLAIWFVCVNATHYSYRFIATASASFLCIGLSLSLCCSNRVKERESATCVPNGYWTPNCSSPAFIWFLIKKREKATARAGLTRWHWLLLLLFEYVCHFVTSNVCKRERERVCSTAYGGIVPIAIHMERKHHYGGQVKAREREREWEVHMRKRMGWMNAAVAEVEEQKKMLNKKTKNCSTRKKNEEEEANRCMSGQCLSSMSQQA